MNRAQLIRLKPLGIFFFIYTISFFLLMRTFSYTFPFLAGFLLAWLIQPIIRFFKKHLHMKEGLASLIATLIAFSILLGLLFLLSYWLVYEIYGFVQNLSHTDFQNHLEPILNLFNQAGVWISKIDSAFLQQNQEQLLQFAKTGVNLILTVCGSILTFLTSLPTIFTMFLTMVFSTYFFSKDLPSLKRYFAPFFTADMICKIRSARRQGSAMGGKYLCSYLLIYFITFLETLIIFLLLGVPYPLMLAIITGIADILPVLGPGTIYLPMALVYLLSGHPWIAFVLFICWLLISAIRQVIEPKIVSASIHIHPLIMLAAIYFSLVAGNFWILLYFTFLLLLYQILTQIGILPYLFEERRAVSKR